MSVETVTVKILDKDYQVSCGPDEKNALIDSARHLDESMRNIKASSNVIGLERIAVMAALNITHELLQASKQNKLSEKIVGRLNNKINDVLNTQSELL